MNHGLSLLRDGELPLSLRLFKEIHKELLVNVRGSERNPGEFRTTQNWIGSHGVLLSDAIYVPPPPGPQMMEALGAFEIFLHEEKNIPELVKIGFAHAQFETIHPFLDGNGRMGRLLITFYLCHQGILSRPLLYLSHFFKSHRDEYYGRLQAVRDQGDWEGWVKFFLEGVYAVALEARHKVHDILNLREKHRNEIVSKISGVHTQRAITLLESLFNVPYVDSRDAASRLGIGGASAIQTITALENIGIIHEKTGKKRNRQYRYDEYLEILNS